MNPVKKAATVTLMAGGLVVASTGVAMADAGAAGAANNSPGVISGNTIQVPINVPINLCGNTINVIGLLNPAAGNICINDYDEHHGGKGHDGRGHDGRGHDRGGRG